VDEGVDQQEGGGQGAEHQHRHQGDGQPAEQAGAAADPAGVAGDDRGQQHELDGRQQPAGADPLAVGEQDGEHDRGQHGPGGRPPGLADGAWR
jgi:hypothetical protein